MTKCKAVVVLGISAGAGGAPGSLGRGRSREVFLCERKSKQRPRGRARARPRERMLARTQGRGTHVCTGWRWESKHSTAPGKQKVTGTVEGRKLGCGWHLTKSFTSRETIVYHPNWDMFRVTFCTWENEYGDGLRHARHVVT